MPGLSGQRSLQFSPNTSLFIPQVFLCGDSSEAKRTVADLSGRLGLSVVDRGSLLASRELEDFPLQLFPLWRLPLRLAAGLAAFFFFYVLTVDVIYSAATVKPEDRVQDRSFRIMVSLANKVYNMLLYIYNLFKANFCPKSLSYLSQQVGVLGIMNDAVGIF